jgi:hypothetical protein
MKSGYPMLVVHCAFLAQCEVRTKALKLSSIRSGWKKMIFPSLPAIDGSRSGSRDRVWLVSELIQSLIRVRYPFGNAPSPVMKHCLTGP